MGHTPVDTMLEFPGFPSFLVYHGVFNRHGGVSPAPWDTQNVSFGLGDSAVNVQANRERIKKALGCKHLVAARQVHGDRVHIAGEDPLADLEVDGFDALASNVPGLGLMIQQADCQAVMLFDPENMAVAIAHVGWRGTVAHVITKTVCAMRDAFATEPAALTAAISPSLGPCCAEFVNFQAELPASMHGYQVRLNYFDFWAISRDQLHAAGVKPQNIHIARVCTRCSRDYFSYRREKVTGRFASVIGLKEVAG